MKWRVTFYWSWTKFIIGINYDDMKWWDAETMCCITIHLGPATIFLNGVLK